MRAWGEGGAEKRAILMGDLMNLKLVNVPPENWLVAAQLAKQFDDQHPQSSGIQQGVAYTKKGNPSFYIYRTKTSLVVLGQEAE